MRTKAATPDRKVQIIMERKQPGAGTPHVMDIADVNVNDDSPGEYIFWKMYRRLSYPLPPGT